ncbi:DNA_LIGASE_A3 domain-containing protein, partial [Haematococcus lacustris]
MFAVHRSTGLRLYVDETKWGVLSCLGYSAQLMRDTFTTDPAASPIHVTGWGFLGDTWPYFRPNFTNMEAVRQQYGAQRVVGFCPTGWLHEVRKTLRESGSFPVRHKGGRLQVHLVPYSEHSSFPELQEYVKWVKPHKVIPTVNVEGAEGERKLRSMLKVFGALVDQTAGKAALLAGMR